MARTITCILLFILTPALHAGEGVLRAKYLITVADDFIVDVYHNGRYVPDKARRLILERFGATGERIDIEVREGDWLVFNVVNNRLRWGGAYYFAVAGCFARDEFGFVSQLDTGEWSSCDDPSAVDRFISEREYLQHRSAHRITRPWHEGTKFMRQHAGAGWNGTPIWGAKKNTWIKVVIGEGRRSAAETPSSRAQKTPRTKRSKERAGTTTRPERQLARHIQGTIWSTSPGSPPFISFHADGAVQGARASIRGRWYAINDCSVIAEWKRQIYVIVFDPGLESAQVYRKGQRWQIVRKRMSGRL